MSIEMYYGNYRLEPAPLFTSTFGPLKNGDGEAVGSAHSITLDGWLVNLNSGLSGILAYQYDLRTAFAQDGQLFQVLCGGEVLFECYPRIRPEGITFSQSPDNWTRTSPYSLTLDFDLEVDGDEFSSLHPPFIQNSSESWTIEPVEDKNWFQFETSTTTDIPPYQFRVSHNVAAVGVAHWDAGGLTTKAWEHAKEYVQSRLGFQSDKVASENILNLNEAQLTPYNHIRTVTSDEKEGNYNVSETWLVIDPTISSPNLHAIEDFTIEARINREDSENFVTINGTIEGLESRVYSPDFNITESKYEAAKDYWEMVADSLRILPRVLEIASQHSITLNPLPNVKVVTHSPSQGIISYSYDYDDSPCNCIEGSKFESIVVTDNRPVDVFASLGVIGRPQGPILQDLNTVTSFTRDVAIEITMERDDECECPSDGISNFLQFNNLNPHDQVEPIICSFQDDLEATYDQIFVTNDSESWDVKQARYTRNISWIAQNCDTAPTIGPTCA